MRAVLPQNHYAANWSIDQVNTTDEISEMGRQHGLLPDGPEREALLLRLVESFHGYTMKYLTMICSGQMPQFYARATGDASTLLRFFLPRGKEPTRDNLMAACRTLHLAFKGMEPGEIYDVLVMCVIKAIQKYDHRYHQKVRCVVDAISARITSASAFQPHALLIEDFDPTPYLRLLVKRGYLKPFPKKKGHRVIGYKRLVKKWPPPKEFLGDGGPVGLTYHIQIWFRYFLQRHIDTQMRILENKRDVMQLDHFTRPSHHDRAGELETMSSSALPHAEGNMTDAKGMRWAVDRKLSDAPLDIGSMNLKWISETNDPLFSDLAKAERQLLYMVFVQDASWKKVAQTMRMGVKDVHACYEAIVEKLRGKVGV